MREIFFLLLLILSGANCAFSKQKSFQFGYDYNEVWVGRVDKGVASISAYTGPGGEVVVPTAVRGYPVVGVNLCKQTISWGGGYPPDIIDHPTVKITDLTVPGSVRHFTGIYGPNLKTLTIRDGVQFVGQFFGSEGSFWGCTSLTSVRIPDSVKGMGPSVFSRCSALSQVHLGRGLTNIPPAAFSGTAITDLPITPNIKTIGMSAFAKCKNLKEIFIPGSVKAVEDDAFRDCSSLKSVIIEEGVERLDGFVFINCVNLETIVVPNSVQIIGEDAFKNCPKLKNITIPERFRDYVKLRFRLGLTSEQAKALVGEAQDSPIH